MSLTAKMDVVHEMSTIKGAFLRVNVTHFLRFVYLFENNTLFRLYETHFKSISSEVNLIAARFFIVLKWELHSEWP